MCHVFMISEPPSDMVQSTRSESTRIHEGQLVRMTCRTFFMSGALVLMITAPLSNSEKYSD